MQTTSSLSASSSVCGSTGTPSSSGQQRPAAPSCVERLNEPWWGSFLTRLASGRPRSGLRQHGYAVSQTHADAPCTPLPASLPVKHHMRLFWV
jgi:hypothetical protein